MRKKNKDVIAAFISKIIKLTDKDELFWRRGPLLIETCQLKGVKISAERPRDGKPTIYLNSGFDFNADVILEGYEYFSVLKAIDRQYKRKKLYEYRKISKGEKDRLEIRRKIEKVLEDDRITVFLKEHFSL